MQATRGTVVSFNYTLTDDNGTVLDTSEGSAPLAYLHGHDNIIPGLEKALEGVEPGFKSEVVIEPADAYGEADKENIFEMEKDAFPSDMPLAPGMQFIGETPSGETPLTIIEVQDKLVIVDANHPLAGVRLHFDIEVTEVREATDAELDIGYPDQEFDQE